MPTSATTACLESRSEAGPDPGGELRARHLHRDLPAVLEVLGPVTLAMRPAPSSRSTR
jgi:hypothetical protein